MATTMGGNTFGSPNFSAYGAPNFAAYAAPNFAAYSAPNFAAYAAPNFAAYAAPNFAAYAAPNFAAYAAPNFAAYAAPNFAAYAPPAWGGPGAPPPPALVGGGTGAGGASGTGFVGGYGPVARFEYATPAGLGPLPWILDFASGDGWPSFPLEQRLNPYAFDPPLEWRAADWDPALRFWTLPFDRHLTEWLQDLNLAAPAVTAAREFAASSKEWLAGETPPSTMQTAFEAAGPEVWAWRGKFNVKQNRWLGDPTAVDNELEELADLMRDDRMRYLEEAGVQSGQATPYFVHLMGFDPASKPWTMELMNCASAIGNLVKMQYKSHYRRVRPSFLCPGLTPPWGPPRHPAFPSGHSTVTHLTALFLLSVPGIAERFGIFDRTAVPDSAGRMPRPSDFIGATALKYGQDQSSPLLWLAWRVAKGRERLGLHYPSDSAAGRLLAALVWQACLVAHKGQPQAVPVPKLLEVLDKARAEWTPASLAYGRGVEPA